MCPEPRVGALLSLHEHCGVFFEIMLKLNNDFTVQHSCVADMVSDDVQGSGETQQARPSRS